jgi:hypothetical protein
MATYKHLLQQRSNAKLNFKYFFLFLSNVLILAAPYVRMVLQDNVPKLSNGTRVYDVEWMEISPVQVSRGATIHRSGGYRSDLGSARVYTYCVPFVLRVTTRARHATAAAILRQQISSTLQTQQTSYPPTRGRSKTLIFPALPQLQPQLVLFYNPL